MENGQMLEQLRTILVERLKFDAGRAAEVTAATTLPKGIDGSLGLDSLDFIELSMGIEERFGLLIDEREDLDKHFESFESLIRYINARMAQG